MKSFLLRSEHGDCVVMTNSPEILKACICQKAELKEMQDTPEMRDDIARSYDTEDIFNVFVKGL